MWFYVVVTVTVCARDNLQKFLFIMLELCLVPDVAYYARFSARLICGCLTTAPSAIHRTNDRRGELERVNPSLVAPSSGCCTVAYNAQQVLLNSNVYSAFFVRLHKLNFKND